MTKAQIATPSQIEWDHVLLSNNRREESMFWERENEKGHGEEEIAAARAASLRQMERLAEMCDQVAFKCGPASLVVAASKTKKAS